MTIEKTNNTLLQKMPLDVPENAACLDRIWVKPGPWPADLALGDGYAYFPDDSLISLAAASGEAKDVHVAVVGRLGFWKPRTSGVANLQTRVLREGNVHRLDCAVLVNEPHRYAPWFVSMASASQRLIGQMAQMAFCAHHHDTTQRLASWLLICLHQSPFETVRIRLADIPVSLQQSRPLLEEALRALEAHTGLQRGQDLVGVQVWMREAEQLNGLSCGCHRRINAL